MTRDGPVCFDSYWFAGNINEIAKLQPDGNKDNRERRRNSFERSQFQVPSLQVSILQSSRFASKDTILEVKNDSLLKLG